MKEWKKVFLLTLAALIYRTAICTVFRKDLIPGGDQVQIILLARKFASGDFYGVLDTYWPPFYPVLVGIVTFFVDSLILPSVLISIVAGSIAIPLTYLFIRQSYGEREALIGGLIAAFYPHLINSVFNIGSENIYFLLIIGALYFGWQGLEKNSARLYMLTGVLNGLAYLTRPEAFGYLAFFVLFALIKDKWKGEKFSASSLKLVATLLIGFAVIATPYLSYLRVETGIWTVSGKIERNFAYGQFNTDDHIGTATVPTEVSPLVIVPSLVSTLFYIQNEILDLLIPFFLLLIVGLGLFGFTWNPKRFRREIFLIFFCLFTIIGYGLAVAQTRYFFILLPIFFGWIACGLIRLNEWFHASFAERLPARLSIVKNAKFVISVSLVLIFLYVFPINSFVRSTPKKWKSNPYEARAAGLWIKENSKPTDLVFSASRTPAFYAELKQLNPESENTDKVFADLVKQKAQFVVLSERELKRNQFLEGFEKRFQNNPMFELVYQENKEPGYGVLIFRSKFNATK